MTSLAGIDPRSLAEALNLESLDDRKFRGSSPASNLERVFGGQLIAQALTAAGRTVPDDLSAHSLHAYFLRPGTPAVHIDYGVTNIRDGRDFSMREIRGSQNGKELLTMSASFARGQSGPTHQAPMPDVPPPSEFANLQHSDTDFSAFHRGAWPDWDLRRVKPTAGEPNREPVQQVWLRHCGSPRNARLDQASALAFASDLTLLACSRIPHVGDAIQTTSLDHSLWFLREFCVDDWLLYDQTSPSGNNGRGLSQGRFFDTEGRLVAVVAQEGLLRYNENHGYIGGGPWDL